MGVVAVVRPGVALRQPADLRGAARSQGACPTTPRETSRRGSCRSRTRGRSSTPARRGRSPTCSRPPRPASSRRRASATAWTVLERLNRRHAAANEGDSRLESRIAAYELAARMQRSAPEALDLGRRDTGHASALWTRRSRDGRLRPPLPAGSPAARARRAVRAGLERRGRARRTTGTTTPTSRTSCPPIARTRRPADRRAAARPEGPRPAGRHAGRLEHRVRPPAVHPGGHRPRPQRRHVGRLAGRRGHQGGRAPTARATPGPGRPPRARPTATTCTPRSCT